MNIASAVGNTQLWQPLIYSQINALINTLIAALGISVFAVSSLFASELTPIEQFSTRSHSAAPMFVLTSVSFTGNTAYSDETLQQIAAPYIGQTIRQSDLEALRIRLSTLYIDDGYISSGAQLPDQNVINGHVTFHLVEGQLDNHIEVTGSGRLKPQYITDRVRLGLQGPLNRNSLQKNFQYLLDDPLIGRLNGQLYPIPGTDRSGLSIAVTRARPVELSLSADNYQAPSVGAEQATFSGIIRNTGGYGDEWRFSVGTGTETVRFGIGTTYRLNARNTTVTFDLSSSQNTIIEEPLDSIDITSDSWSAELALAHPITLDPLYRIELGAGLTLKENNNELLGLPFSFTAGEIDGQSRVSVVKLWQAYTSRHSSHVADVRSTFNLGTTAFNATRHDDDRPDSQFITWQGQGQYIRRLLNGKAEWRLRTDVQLANQALLPLERFSVGGVSTVRGYRENTLVRDQAIVFSSELRYRFYQSGNAGSFELVPFIDYGYARDRGANKNAESLLSAGLGLRWTLDNRWFAELHYGYAIEEVANPGNNDLQDKGIHFKLKANVW